MPSPARRLSPPRPLRPSRQGRAVLGWLVLSCTLLACSAGEQRERRRLQRGLDLRLAELSERAQNLPRHREEQQALEARERLQCAPDTARELSARIGQAAPGTQVSVREQRGRAVWLLVTGEGPGTSLVSAVDGLARQAPFFSLEEASATEDHWTLVLRSARPCPLPRRLPSPAPPPLASPPRADAPAGQGVEGARLRQGIAETEERIRMLLNVLGPNLNLRERLDELRSTVEEAERDNDRSEDGVRRRLPLLHALFDAPGPVSGTLRTYRRELVYEGGIALAEEQWNARLDAAGFRVARRDAERRVLIPD